MVAALFALVVAGVCWKSRTASLKQFPELVFAVAAALFILNPTCFPWYFCWVLPFAVFRPRFSWLLLAGLLPLNYLDFHSAASMPFAHAHWRGLYWLPTAIWGIFAVAWFGERRIAKSR